MWHESGDGVEDQEEGRGRAVQYRGYKQGVMTYAYLNVIMKQMTLYPILKLN